jgi:hypothetical protein
MIQKKISKKSGFLKKVGALAMLQILALPELVSAQAGMPKVNIPTNVNIDKMAGKIGAYFFGAVLMACVFMVLWAALDLATAGGDENKVTGAKQRIKYAIIGLIVASLSVAIVSLVRTAIGV